MRRLSRRGMLSLMKTLSQAWTRVVGYALLLCTAPLLWTMVRALMERDYVAAGFELVAAALVGHLGLEAVALVEAAE